MMCNFKLFLFVLEKKWSTKTQGLTLPIPTLLPVRSRSFIYGLAYFPNTSVYCSLDDPHTARLCCSSIDSMRCTAEITKELSPSKTQLTHSIPVNILPSVHCGQHFLNSVAPTKPIHWILRSWYDRSIWMYTFCPRKLLINSIMTRI